MSGNSSLLVILPTKKCVVCLKLKSTELFMPCRHMVSCSKCSKTIVNSKLTCPICRHKIEKCQPLVKVEYGYSKDVSKNEIDSYLETYHKRYLKFFTFDIDLNAGWSGNSKMAKSVKREFNDAFNNASLDRSGTDRYGALNITHNISSDNILVTNFQVGRDNEVESLTR